MSSESLPAIDPNNSRRGGSTQDATAKLGRLVADMSRIPLLHETDPTLSSDARTFLEQTGKARGKMLNLYRALANRPEAGRALSELIRAVYRSGSTLQPKEAELAYLTATVVNDCYY